MEKILEGFEKQQSCTATSGLETLTTLVLMLLSKSYPNVLERPLEKEYDFIVVGAGSAGSVIASRLSENQNWTVLLLEAGGEEPEITRVPGLIKTDGMFNTAYEWHFKTEPNPNYCDGQPCTYGRGKMLGGCDGHNGMWYLRGNRKMFDDNVKRGLEGWSYDEVWPYFDRRATAQELEDDGTISNLSIERFNYIDKNVDCIMEAYREFGIFHPDRNGNIIEGYLTTSKNGTRISANRLYIEKTRWKRKNLHVLTDTFVTKIITDLSTKTATAVEAYITKGDKQEKRVIKARKEIFVCAGVINSPKLLQLSGIGPKQLLEKFGIPVIKDLKVGYNFMNHPLFRGINITLTSTSTVPPDCEAIRSDIINYITNKSGPLSSTGAFNSYLLFNSSRSTKEFPDILIAFNPFIQGLGIKDPYFCTSYYNALNLGVMAGRTESRGTVFIQSSNPFVAPKIELALATLDIERISEGCLFAHKLANSKALKKAGMIADNTPDPRCKHLEYASYEYWKCAMEGKITLWLHGMGTCSMGRKGDPNAVTDNKCKVMGIKNLRVADCSISPDVTNANINSVCMMIGEKCADFCIYDHIKSSS